MNLQGPREVCSTVVWHLVRSSAAFLLAFLMVSSPALATCPTCSSSPCTISGTHTLAGTDVCDYTGKDVILTGTMQGDNNTGCYEVIADNFTVRGTLRARGSCVVVTVSGNFKTEVVSNSAATVDVRNADSPGDGFFLTCGTATINGRDINADADGDQSPAYYPSGDISFDCTGTITGTGGPIHATATGGDDGGDITLFTSEGAIDLTSAQDVSGGGDFSFGGSIYIEAGGNVTLGSSTRSLQAQSAQGGFAGSIEIYSSGTATINGGLNVNGNGEDSDGGSITVDAGSVITGSTWNARGDQGGDGGSIDVTANSGTVTTTAGSASWNVQGSGAPDDGGWGGAISVSAVEDITLNGDMDAAGSGDSASGGGISIVTDGDITVQSVSRIEADSTGTDASDGYIDFSGCNITVAGDIDTRNTSLDSGTNTFDYGGTFVQNSGSTILADDDGGNDFNCRCVDTSPADGICDSPATCANAPTLNGTVTPAANINKVARAACN